ncbi:MAG TPA: NAD(P)H-dependent glycerol-3-phosphate dehydrogenase [Elusimicrobiota bacterium]|nr:NAD(P)H-dependent glycerol-3-phosphate dehydrogenase [Elusimicrobiota bacterium]
MTEKICVLGAGSWGSALAHLLAQKGHDVSLWEFYPAAAEKLEKTRMLAILPQLKLHSGVRVTSRIDEALQGKALVVSATPSEFVRATFGLVKKSLGTSPSFDVVSVTKGIENATLKRMSEVIEDEIPALHGRVAVLSGPSHAEEVILNTPTAVVTAGPTALAERVQSDFSTDHFRVYTHPDFLGVELGGALKNIYAIATGACDGLGLGDNTKAALMTRALYEMARLGISMGANVVTFFGLSGLGDLIVTCGSRHSRNRLLGEKIGQGKTLAQALAEMTMVAEGVRTTQSVYDLSMKMRLELPIVNEIHRCLYEGKSAKDSLHDLLMRPVKPEMMHFEKIISKIQTPQ